MMLKCFEKNGLANGEYSIHIPNGSIGRPGDEVYELRETIVDDWFHVIFIGGIHFLFDKTSEFHFYKNSLFVVIQKQSFLKLGIETVLNRDIEVKKLEYGIVSLINVGDGGAESDFFEFTKLLEP